MSLYERITTSRNKALSVPSNFLHRLIATSSQNWIYEMKEKNVNIFEYDMIMMPFYANGHRSLFVVVGASYIQDYMKCGFSNERPCILHILPYQRPTRAQTQAYNAASAKIRSWLNALWRVTYCVNDIISMPFTHRSLPLTQPYGNFIQNTLH